MTEDCSYIIPNCVQEEMRQVAIKKGNNRRKGMVLCGIWLWPEEEKLLLDSFEKGINSTAWTIIKTAHERGDFNRQ